MDLLQEAVLPMAKPELLSAFLIIVIIKIIKNINNLMVNMNISIVAILLFSC